MAQCARHIDSEAVATCERCGRFVCAECTGEESAQRYCSECLLRPDVRLVPSKSAKRSLLFALLALNGVVVLLPAVWLMARAEERAIVRGDAPQAGQPWVKATRTVLIFAIMLWSIIARAVFNASNGLYR